MLFSVVASVLRFVPLVMQSVQSNVSFVESNIPAAQPHSKLQASQNQNTQAKGVL